MSSMTFRKVRSASQSDDGAVQIELFRDESGKVCGWFLGPVRISGTKIAIPYLPRSARAQAAIAVVRAIEASNSLDVPLCVIDPDDLWTPAWQNGQA